MDNEKFKNLMGKLFNEELLIAIGKKLFREGQDQGTWTVDTAVSNIYQHLTTPLGWAKFMVALREGLELEEDYEGRYHLGRILEKVGKEI